MLTVKSIVTGALVLGAATVLAGVVVSDFSGAFMPEAPGAIVADAPVLTPTWEPLDAPLVSAVLVIPAPRRVIDAAEPVLAAASFVEIALAPAVLRPPTIVPVRGVAGPEVDVTDLGLDGTRLAPVPLIAPGAETSDRV